MPDPRPDDSAVHERILTSAEDRKLTQVMSLSELLLVTLLVVALVIVAAMLYPV
jgi:hypothetical protein